MTKQNNLHSFFCGILFCISVVALIIACLAFTKKGGGGEYYGKGGGHPIGGLPPGPTPAPLCNAAWGPHIVNDTKRWNICTYTLITLTQCVGDNVDCDIDGKGRGPSYKCPGKWGATWGHWGAGKNWRSPTDDGGGSPKNYILSRYVTGNFTPPPVRSYTTQYTGSKPGDTCFSFSTPEDSPCAGVMILQEPYNGAVQTQVPVYYNRWYYLYNPGKKQYASDNCTGSWCTDSYEIPDDNSNSCWWTGTSTGKPQKYCFFFQKAYYTNQCTGPPSSPTCSAKCPVPPNLSRDYCDACPAGRPSTPTTGAPHGSPPPSGQKEKFDNFKKGGDVGAVSMDIVQHGDKLRVVSQLGDNKYQYLSNNQGFASGNWGPCGLTERDANGNPYDPTILTINKCGPPQRTTKLYCEGAACKAADGDAAAPDGMILDGNSNCAGAWNWPYVGGNVPEGGYGKLSACGGNCIPYNPNDPRPSIYGCGLSGWKVIAPMKYGAYGSAATFAMGKGGGFVLVTGGRPGGDGGTMVKPMSYSLSARGWGSHHRPVSVVNCTKTDGGCGAPNSCPPGACLNAATNECWIYDVQGGQGCTVCNTSPQNGTCISCQKFVPNVPAHEQPTRDNCLVSLTYPYDGSGAACAHLHGATLHHDNPDDAFRIANGLPGTSPASPGDMCYKAAEPGPGCDTNPEYSFLTACGPPGNTPSSSCPRTKQCKATDKWGDGLPPLPAARYLHASVTLKQHFIFILGGRTCSAPCPPWGQPIVDEPVMALDLNASKMEWLTYQSTGFTPRHSCAAAVLGEKIYVAGGFGVGKLALAIVEVFDPGSSGPSPENGTWSRALSMQGPRVSFALIALEAGAPGVTGEDGMLVAAGGCKGGSAGRCTGGRGGAPPDGGAFLKSAEILQVSVSSTAQWTPIRPMKYARIGCAGAALDGDAHVMGGLVCLGKNCAPAPTNTVERLFYRGAGPAIRTWRWDFRVPGPMNSPRAYHAATAFSPRSCAPDACFTEDGHPRAIYVMGGCETVASCTIVPSNVGQVNVEVLGKMALTPWP